MTLMPAQILGHRGLGSPNPQEENLVMQEAMGWMVVTLERSQD